MTERAATGPGPGTGGGAGPVAAVAIGRNEGARLDRCLAALDAQVDRIVYVDSGSTDGSVALARSRGAEVVELDMSRPFTAARGRNAGIARLAKDGLPDFVQFVDGDCEIQPGWIDAARAAFAAEEDLGIVTGWRTELTPDANIYAVMAEHEWRRPAGIIEACGGDMMVRRAVLEQTGGFNPAVIAAEDDDFCVRARGQGWRIRRLPRVMTVHDLGMTRFGQWWKRMERAGHGYAQLGHLHRGYFRASRRRAVLAGLVLPLAILAGLATGQIWLAALALAVYALSLFRTARSLRRSGERPADALRHAGFLTISNFPSLIGMARFYWRHLAGRRIELIEYK